MPSGSDEIEAKAFDEALAAGAAADRRLRRGLLIAVLGVGMLALGTRLEFWDVLGLPILLLLLPALAVAQLPLLRFQRIDRMAVYLGSIGTIAVLGVVSLVLGLRVGGRASIGLDPIGIREWTSWTIALTLAAMLVIGVSLLLDRDRGAGSSSLLAELLPRTPRERWVFAALSVSAGVGEELAYRGYVLVALQLLPMGPWTAAGLSSVAFGVLHAYQGPIGIGRTALVGFLFAAGFLLSGSLLPAIAAHALVDLLAGLVLGPFLIRRERATGPLDPTSPLG